MSNVSEKDKVVSLFGNFDQISVNAQLASNANIKLVHSLEILLGMARSGNLRSFAGTGICSDQHRVAVQHFGDVSPLTTVGAVRLLGNCVEDFAYAILDPRTQSDDP